MLDLLPERPSRQGMGGRARQESGNIRPQKGHKKSGPSSFGRAAQTADKGTKKGSRFPREPFVFWIHVEEA